MSSNEKRKLGQDIRTLPPEYLRGVWEIVTDGSNGHTAKEEIEIDLDKLSPAKARRLEDYVNEKLAFIYKTNTKRKNKGQGKNSSTM